MVKLRVLPKEHRLTKKKIKKQFHSIVFLHALKKFMRIQVNIYCTFSKSAMEALENRVKYV